MNDDNLISGFDANGGNEAPFAVDFDVAKLLDVAGSTCDVYECTVQRRRTFVKRLKAEYRNNPLYRAAFSKEYDLGVSLSHPSLPRYVGFGGEYIVMDFIEGDTLADMMKRDDKRLKNKRFVRKLLRELIDVTEYLHYRNIVHCDIKADNIIISPYPDRPATLIDFDKAYSPWLGSTHGNTAKYGCDNCEDGAIDFKGIGMIAEKLGLWKLARVCNRSDVTADELRQVLNSGSSRWAIGGIATLIIAGVGGLVLYNDVSADKPANKDVTVSVDSAKTNVEREAAALPADSMAVRVPSTIQPTTIQPTAPQKSAIDNAWISALISENAAVAKTEIQELLVFLNNEDISVSERKSAIPERAACYIRAQSRILEALRTRYKDLDEMDLMNALTKNPKWDRFIKEGDEEMQKIINWQAKESQRLSDRPVSPPDTTQDADLHAQHR